MLPAVEQITGIYLMYTGGAPLSDLVLAGYKRCWAEKEPVALIGILAGAASLIIFQPAIQLDLLEMLLFWREDSETEETFFWELAAVWPLFLLMLLFHAAVLVVLIRLAARQRAHVLAGGIKAFSRRIKWLIWRILGATVLFSLTFATLRFVTFKLWMPFSLFSLFLAIIALPLFLSAVSLSLVSECTDRHLPIRHAWVRLKGQRFDMATTLFALSVLMFFVSTIPVNLVAGAAENPEGIRIVPSLLYLANIVVVTFFFFFWFSATAKASRKIKWPKPGLVPAKD